MRLPQNMRGSRQKGIWIAGSHKAVYLLNTRQLKRTLGQSHWRQQRGWERERTAGGPGDFQNMSILTQHTHPHPPASWNSTTPLACGLSLPVCSASGLYSQGVKSKKVHSSCPAQLKRHSPYPGLFVRHSVLLHEACEPQQRALVKQVDLASKLPVDLEGL